MQIIITITIVYTLSFLLFFKFVYRGRKEDDINIFQVIFVTALLALIPAGVAAFFIFVLLGSTNLVTYTLDLSISTKQLIKLSLFLLGYLITIDSIIEMILKMLINNPYLYQFLLCCIRASAFYLIGEMFVLLPHKENMIIAIGVAVILLIIEVLYHFQDKKKSAV